MKKINSKTRQNGLTLVELLISTIIIVLIASVAAPSMRALFEKKNIFAIGDHFVKTIKLARVEAIQRGKTVRVIPTAADNNGTSDWSKGWHLEFTNNSNPDNIFIEVIRTFPAVSGSPRFGSYDYTQSRALSIAPTGQASPLGNFELQYDDCVGEQRLTFSILTSGLIKRGVSEC